MKFLAHWKFWTLWGFDAAIAGVEFYFFLVGLNDNTVSERNIPLWLVLLAIPAVVLLGSVFLRATGHVVIAWILLSLMALPGCLFGLFFLAAVLLHPRWN